MTSYAYAHPDLTVGIVLAETPHAIIPLGGAEGAACGARLPQ